MANTYRILNIAGGAGGSDDRRVKVSTDDSLPGFLEEKIEAGSSKIIITVDTPGGAETLQVDLDEAQIDHNALLNYDVDQHRDLDDASTTTSSLWSSDKIQTELDSKINAATPMTDDKLVKSVGTSGVDVEATGISVDDSDNVTGINDLTIDGNLTVSGTTTTIDSTELTVTDANITINNGGTQASADAGNAGLTVEMSDSTDVELGYDSTTASKMALGEIGSQSEVITANHTQTLVNKSLDIDNNTLSNVETDNLKAGVLQTDISGGVSDTNLPSSQAVKTYITDQLALQDDASEITYTPSTVTDWDGDVDPGETNVALDQLAERTNTAEGTLATHLDGGAAKHTASSITNTPAGNIIATELQAAINELDTEKYVAADFDGDFDTRLGTKDTADLAEGTNLYYTEGRVSANTTVTSNAAKISADGSVTTHNDVTDAGSGLIITDAERTTLGTALQSSDNISELTNDSSFVDASGAQTAAVVNSTAGSETVQAPSVAAMKSYADGAAAIGGNLSAGDIKETFYSGSADVASSEVITGLAFANGVVRSFKAQVSVVIDSTLDLYEEFELNGMQKGSSWDMSIESVGDDSGVSFDITAAGQITYSKGSVATWVSTSFRFRSDTTSI